MEEYINILCGVRIDPDKYFLSVSTSVKETTVWNIRNYKGTNEEEEIEATHSIEKISTNGF